MANQNDKALDQQDIITLTDNEGNSAEFEFLADIEYDGNHYIVILPDFDNEESEEVVILQVMGDEEEGEWYDGVDDEDVVDAVFELFKQENADAFDFSDDE